jgi:hypothetical protein
MYRYEEHPRRAKKLYHLNLRLKTYGVDVSRAGIGTMYRYNEHLIVV